MAGTSRTLALVAAGLIAGGAAGVYAGWTLRASSIVSLWINTNANAAEEMVGALELLRADRRDESLATLERHLNRHVFGLMPTAREGVTVSDGALERAEAARRSVAEYRRQHPYSGSTALDRDVARFLSGP